MTVKSNGSGDAECEGGGSAGFGYQCVDLAYRLYLHRGWGTVTAGGDGGAKNIDGSSHADLSAKPNNGTYTPKTGDLIVEGATSSNSWGHVAVVNSVSGSTIVAVEQNASATGYHTYTVGSDGVVGGGYGTVLRFVTSSKNDIAAETEEASSEEEDDLAQHYPGRSAVVSDGFMFVFATGDDGNVWHRWRRESDNQWSNWWNNWSGNGSPNGVNFVGEPTAVVSDGFMFVFATGDDGNVWHRWRRESDNQWSNWWNNWSGNGSPNGVNFVGEPTAVVSDGFMFVFATGDDGNVWHRWRRESDNQWSNWWNNWSGNGSPNGVNFVGEPTAVVSDGFMFVFATGDDGNVWHRWRRESDNQWSNWWNNWSGNGSPNGVNFVGEPTAVVSDGFMFVFATGDDGNVWHRWRRESDNQWSNWWNNWSGNGSPNGVNFVGEPTAVVSDGFMFVFATGDDGNVWHRWRRESDNQWSNWWNNWSGNGSPNGVNFVGEPTAVVSDGFMFVFATGDDGNVWHRWRRESDNQWSNWWNNWSGNGSPNGVNFVSD